MAGSQHSPDGAELVERNLGSARKSRIPAFGLHPGYKPG
jgi:hypothetical protein